MSQEHPSCQVLWWEESSVSTRVRVPAIPCAWFYYSSGILCSRIWLSPPLDWGTCEDNVLLMFNPHSLVCCLPDKCHLDEWMEVSYKLTLSSTLTTSPPAGAPFLFHSQYEPCHLFFLFFSSQSPPYSIICSTHAELMALSWILEIQSWSWEPPNLHPQNFPTCLFLCLHLTPTLDHAFQICSETHGPFTGITWEALTMTDVRVPTKKTWCHWSWEQTRHKDLKKVFLLAFLGFTW